MTTLRLTLPPNRTPVATLRSRSSGAIVGSTIAGSAVSGRPVLYDFNLGSTAAGDYEVDITDPVGSYKMTVTSTAAYVADEWWQLDQRKEVLRIPRSATEKNAGQGVVKTNTSISPNQTLTEAIT